MSIEKDVGKLLREKGLTVGMVESATGGVISNLITDVPGSSAYFKGSVISYNNEVKINLVGVRAETILRYGAVSPQVVKEMARGGRTLLGVDICLADTGIAGPDGVTTNKPVGLFYLGLSTAKGTFSRKYLFSGNRKQNKKETAGALLLWLKDYLLSLADVK